MLSVTVNEITRGLIDVINLRWICLLSCPWNANPQRPKPPPPIQSLPRESALELSRAINQPVTSASLLRHPVYSARCYSFMLGGWW
ncbi:hypothetical protein FCM35_KLT19007 [Carex littledalei]|uniref:Uncharacterized protein n=1 Tax=Carex littledalei TaxID=544730 RepID=A0A833RBT2_9POAL|nr:hypothetical protein FCM35_KLT19007 [Carex littledalei]